MFFWLACFSKVAFYGMGFLNLCSTLLLCVGLEVAVTLEELQATGYKLFLVVIQCCQYDHTVVTTPGA